MNDDIGLPPEHISDLDLMRIIERATGKPATLADAKVWRRAIERERTRRSRQRHGMPPVLRTPETESAHAVIVDFLMSPEAQAMIAILNAGRSLAESTLSPAARRVYENMLRQPTISRDAGARINDLYQYAVEKLAPGGRAVQPPPDPAWALSAAFLAALNASTPEALAEWRDRLAAARYTSATRPYLFRRLQEIGSEIMRLHPDLDIGHTMPGPPLGIWPPPPPLDPDAPSAAGTPSAAAAPAPGPGRRL